MSWSTSFVIETAEEGALAELTDDSAEDARGNVRAQLDSAHEHDTFDAAIEAARRLLQFGAPPHVGDGGGWLVSIHGHASATQRSGSASITARVPDGVVDQQP